MKRIMIALVLLAACAAHGAGAAFTVATYNVKVAEKSDGEALSWEKRLPRLVKVMRAGKFDLIGLQEVSRNMEVDFAAALPEYAFVDGPKKDGPVPIAYRPKLFELLESGRFSMSEKPDDFKFVSWGASCVRVCQWALFRVRADGSRIRVFNMHPDWKSCKARAKGMEMSLKRIRAARAKGERVILLGDMNDMQNFKCPEKKNDPQYPYGTSIRLAREVLKDSYDLTKTPHAGPYLTAQWFQPKELERLDYVFLSDGFEVLAHRTHDDRPDGGFPSDHDAVSARLKIVPFPASAGR